MEAGPRSPPAVPATPTPAAPNQQPEQPQTSPTPQTATPAPGPGSPINLFEAAAQRAASQRSGGATRQPAVPGSTPAAPGGAAPPAGTGLSAGMGANLDALRNNPNFLQLRNIVQSNPQLLEPIIQNIAQGNPQFAQLITQNPEAFLQLLAEGGGEGGEGGALPPGAIEVTPEEAEAIGRV
jgi:UV excision repair protein RAD23